MYDNSTQTQKPRELITLEEFFPRKFFQNNLAQAVHTVTRCKIQDEKKDVDHGGPSETLSSLEELQSRVDEVEPLQSSTPPKEVLTQTLEKPEMYTPSNNTFQQTQESYACSPDLTFTEEVLLLGSKPHKRSIVFLLMEVQLLIYYQK